MKPFVWHELWQPRWSPLEVVVRSALVYLVLWLMFRLVGRKELSRYSTFDFAVVLLVTQALRETLVGDDRSLTTGFIALGTILGLDLLLSWLSFRSSLLAALFEGRPRKLMEAGKVIEPALRRSRFTRDELVSRLRRYGIDRLDEVDSAWLERDGKVTFVVRAGPARRPAVRS